MLFKLYRFLVIAGWPFIAVYLARRKLKGKENLDRFAERTGIASKKRPDGTLLWLHGASVGESLSMLPLIDLILEENPSLNILVTTGTITSAELMEKRLPKRAFHQFIPVDTPKFVKRFLDHWKPDIAIWFESDFWPNLIMETSKTDAELILLNGRISDKSFKKWQRYKSFIKLMLNQFSICLGQTDMDAERLKILGAEKTSCVGNIKFGADPLPAYSKKLEDIKDKIKDRKRWLAASTHNGEELASAEIHKELKKDFPDILTIIVPRHPPRGDEIEKEIKATGLKTARRSKKEPIEKDTDIYLADTIGELGIFYRLAKIVFVGKSLIGKGGQNPLEPARLGCTVLTGMHMDNFREMTKKMVNAKALTQLENKEALKDKIKELLNDSETLKSLCDNAEKYAENEAGVLKRVTEKLSPYFREKAK